MVTTETCNPCTNANAMFYSCKSQFGEKKMGTIGRLQEVKNKGKFQTLSSKSGTTVVAYERWLLARGSKYSDLIWKILVFWKTGC